jgi:hypothetical protein
MSSCALAPALPCPASALGVCQLENGGKCRDVPVNLLIQTLNSVKCGQVHYDLSEVT